MTGDFCHSKPLLGYLYLKSSPLVGESFHTVSRFFFRIHFFFFVQKAGLANKKHGPKQIKKVSKRGKKEEGGK